MRQNMCVTCRRIPHTKITYKKTPVVTYQGAVLLTVGRSYVGNDVTHSTLLDRACTCYYKNLPKYRSYRISNTALCFLFHFYTHLLLCIKYTSQHVRCQPANTPVTSLATNNGHFNVQNPATHSIAWSRKAILNTIPAIDVTIYTSRH